MCKEGNFTLVSVPSINMQDPDRLTTWSEQPIDDCLVPFVEALNAKGIYTQQCCCGHGRHKGTIQLYDGRLMFLDNWQYIHRTTSL